LAVLIRAYGEFWSPDLVDWGKPGRGLKGKLEGWLGTQRKPVTIDVWDQRGIYVLQHEWRVVYVGKTGETALGARIRNHLTDRHAGRWDSFSWYGVRGVTAEGELSKQAIRKNVPTADAIASFEALLIAVTDPPGNRRMESIPGATLVRQSGRERPRPLRGLLEDIRQDIQGFASRLKAIEDAM
jgi:hypothetical protein